jgi:hypothetical protein
MKRRDLERKKGTDVGGKGGILGCYCANIAIFACKCRITACN